MTLKAIFIVKEHNNVLGKRFVLFSKREFFIQKFKNEILTLIITNNVSNANGVIINMGEQAKPLYLIFVFFFGHKNHFHIREILTCCNIYNNIFEQFKSIRSRPAISPFNSATDSRILS